MPANINDLPYELLSQILEIVLRSNVEQNSRKTYAFDMGLHAPPDPDVRMQRLLKGLMTPDSVRWTASDTIRRVNPRWHDLALKYSFKDLVSTLADLYFLSSYSFSRLRTCLRGQTRASRSEDVSQASKSCLKEKC